MDVKEKSFPSVERKKSDGLPVGLKVGEHVKILSLQSHGILTIMDESSNQVEVVAVVEVIQYHSSGERERRENLRSTKAKKPYAERCSGSSFSIKCDWLNRGGCHSKG